MDAAAAVKMMKRAIIITFIFLLPAILRAQNCCAPTVPQQGVLGEISALPQALEIGFHYELLRSAEMYDGSKTTYDPSNTKVRWHRATMTAAYGIFRSLSVSAIVPYTWKKKTKYLTSLDLHLENSADGIGDITVIARYSPIMRSFVNYRELSVGLGVKAPTGSVDEENSGIRLSEELQPGTGSWDFDGSFSYYQGFEQVDFLLSGTYLLTTSHKAYRFGNQFSYILASNFHIREYLDLSLSLLGLSRSRDNISGINIYSTGRDQLWLSPGARFQILPDKLSLQAYYEHPIYQRFNGIQLGSDYNVRLSAIYTMQLKETEKKRNIF
jgi:hypothetical protein